MSEIWARRSFFWSVITGLVLIVTPFAIDHFTSNEEEIGTAIRTDTTSDSLTSGKPVISIDSIHVSEVSMRVPGVFELAIAGDLHLAAHDIEVTVDFGRAQVDTCGYVPMSSINKSLVEEMNYRRISIDQIGPRERFYIRCLLTPPGFERIVVTGGEISHTISIDYDEYQSSLISDRTGFWRVLGNFVAAFVAGGLVLKFLQFLFPG